VTVEYLDLADFVAIAPALTGLDEDTIVKIADLGLADSALHAPQAQYGDTEFYEDFIDTATVLVVPLARNPLSDRNERVAGVALRMFVGLNSWSWSPGLRSTTRNRPCSQSQPANGTSRARQRGLPATSNRRIGVTGPTRLSGDVLEVSCVTLARRTRRVHRDPRTRAYVAPPPFMEGRH
jgi:death on curing protein